MKNVLITGAHSYIGTSVERWLSKYPDMYKVTTISVHGQKWRDMDFGEYDVICHVAGIAHRKDASQQMYDDINHKLAVEVFRKSGGCSVKQFIFLSSGAVISQSDRHHKRIVADLNTPLEPSTPYGISKRRAEDDILDMSKTYKMKLAIIRPPMVYGKGCKGNYNALSSFAQKALVFPMVGNERSMIYIDNLCEFIRLLIDNDSEGVFLPQNKNYVNTSRMVHEIAKVHNKRVIFTSAFNWAIDIGSKKADILNKVFGTYIYRKIPYFDNKYQLVDFGESIKRSEGF